MGTNGSQKYEHVEQTAQKAGTKTDFVGKFGRNDPFRGAELVFSFAARRFLASFFVDDLRFV